MRKWKTEPCMCACLQEYVQSQSSYHADDIMELEEDLMCLLPALAPMFDASCAFHQHNRNQDVGGKVGGPPPDPYSTVNPPRKVRAFVTNRCLLDVFTLEVQRVTGLISHVVHSEATVGTERVGERLTLRCCGAACVRR